MGRNVRVIKGKPVKDKSERWLLTFADLMNLLLILFIVLYTMSQINLEKYQQVASSLRNVLGPQEGGGNSKGGVPQVTVSVDEEQNTGINQTEEVQMNTIENKVRGIITKEGLEGNVEVTIEERGLVISIKEKVLFRSGSATIEDEAKNIIKRIGNVLLAIPGKQIRVEGHTDTDPINTAKFPDNQELSTARANSVLRILANDVGINRRLLSATGYGEYRPMAPNTTPENKARNRRVDVTILRDKYDIIEAGSKDQNAGETDKNTGETDRTD